MAAFSCGEHMGASAVPLEVDRRSPVLPARGAACACTPLAAFVAVLTLIAGVSSPSLAKLFAVSSPLQASPHGGGIFSPLLTQLFVAPPPPRAPRVAATQDPLIAPQLPATSRASAGEVRGGLRPARGRLGQLQTWTPGAQAFAGFQDEDDDPETIFVQTARGETVNVDVEERKGVAGLMAQLQELEGIVPARQDLTYAGERLEEGSGLPPSFSWVELQVLPQYFVAVRMGADRAVVIDCEKDDDLHGVSLKFQEQEGIMTDFFELTHGGKQISSARKLFDLVENGATLDIKLKGRRPGADARVFVRTEEGEVITVDVPPRGLCTVGEVKKKIQDREGIPAGRQELTFGGRRLLDSEGLYRYDIRNSSTLGLAVRRASLPIEWENELQRIYIRIQTERGDNITLDVLPWDTVDSVKRKIEAREAIAVQHQELTFEGKHLSGAEPLYAYDIQEYSGLRLAVRRGMRISVQIREEPDMALDVLPWDTVDRVARMVQDRAGISAEHQELSFEGKKLARGPPLSYYGIEPGSALSLKVLRSTPIKVTTDEGRAFKLEVLPWGTVGRVKRRIQLKEGIAADHQELTFAGRQLADDAPLSFYGIDTNSELSLVVRRSSSG